METLIGTQAWSLRTWSVRSTSRNAERKFLQACARRFPAVEVDYDLLRDPAARTPGALECDGPRRTFRFTLKLPREITHEGALVAATHPALHRFFAAARTQNAPGVPPRAAAARFSRDRANSLALRDLVRALPDDLRLAIEFRTPGTTRRWRAIWPISASPWLC